MYSTQVTSQVPARCLFPYSTDTSSPVEPLPVKPTVPFSIGDIMKSVGLPVQEEVQTPNKHGIPLNDNSVTPKLNSQLQPRDDASKTIQEHSGIPHTPKGHQPQGLQLKDLLNNQLPETLSKAANNTSKTHNPFMSFLDKLPHQDDIKICRTPPLPVPLSLHHLQSFPELSSGLPSTFKELTYPGLLTPCPVAPREDSVSAPSHRPDKSLTPSSDISEDLIDVESTSPNGSTTSSGFCSNPSPSPSSTSSTSQSSPTEKVEVSANQRTAYNEKQASRLKQVFQENRYPDVEQYEELSEELNIPIQRIRVWFQNRRARSKKSVADTRMMTYPPQMSAMMPSAPGYGYMTPSPMMPQSMYQYPVSPASMYPMYPPTMYPGYSYPFPYHQ